MAGAFRKGMGVLGAAGSLGLGAAGFAFAKMGGAPLMAAGVGAYGLARKGYSAGSGMFSGSGPSDKPKAIAQDSMVGGAPEVLVEIHKEVSLIRDLMIKGGDPQSQAREQAIDDEVRHRKLLSALSGMGGGPGPGKGGEESTSTWKDKLMQLLPGILALAGIAALPKILENVPDIVDGVNTAFGKIDGFISGLDGFFDSLGIEFGGAAMRGTAAGLAMEEKLRKGRIDKATKKAAALDEKYKKATERSRNRVKTAQARVLDAEEKVKKANAKRLAADEKVKKANQRLKTANTKVTDLEQKIRDNEKRTKNLKESQTKERQRLKNDKLKLRAQLASANGALDKSQKAVTKANGAAVEANERTSRAKARYQAQLAESEARVKSAQADAEKARARAAAADTKAQKTATKGKFNLFKSADRASMTALNAQTAATKLAEKQAKAAAAAATEQEKIRSAAKRQQTLRRFFGQADAASMRSHQAGVDTKAKNAALKSEQNKAAKKLFAAADAESVKRFEADSAKPKVVRAGAGAYGPAGGSQAPTSTANKAAIAKGAVSTNVPEKINIKTDPVAQTSHTQGRRPLTLSEISDLKAKGFQVKIAADGFAEVRETTADGKSKLAKKATIEKVLGQPAPDKVESKALTQKRTAELEAAEKQRGVQSGKSVADKWKLGGIVKKILGKGVAVASIFLAINDIAKLIGTWTGEKEDGDWNPLGKDPADKNFIRGLESLVYMYGGGWIGSLAGAMLTAAIPVPGARILGAIVGGLGGALAGEEILRMLKGEEHDENSFQTAWKGLKGFFGQDDATKAFKRLDELKESLDKGKITGRGRTGFTRSKHTADEASRIQDKIRALEEQILTEGWISPEDLKAIEGTGFLADFGAAGTTVVNIVTNTSNQNVSASQDSTTMIQHEDNSGVVSGNVGAYE